MPLLAQAAWYNSSWKYRKTITIDNTKVEENLSNFPVLISLTDTDLRDNAQSDGDDILFTSSDGTTKLSHEIESFNDSTGQLTAWVKIPSLSSSSDTVIYMYYGNSGASNQQDTANVWDSNFIGVLHLNETVTDEQITGTHNDSTSNGNDGTQQGNDETAGKIAKGQDFDGADDTVDCGSGASLNITQEITLSVWVNMVERPAKGDYYSVVTKTDWKYDVYLYGTEATETNLGGYFKLNTGNVDIWEGPDIDIPPNVWTQVAIAFDGTDFKLYVNGELDYTQNDPGTIEDSSGINVIIGLKDSLYWKGPMDEVRISNTARDPDWIKTCYNSQNSPSTFYGVGDETPVIQFTATSSNGAESATPADLELSLSGAVGQDVTVNYEVTGGTATESGTDYTLASGTATITAGDTTTDISATIVDDSVGEANETIIVTISNPTNTTLGTNTQHTYTITDDDATKLVFNQQPSNTAAGSSISPAMTIQILDANDNVVTSATDDVTIAIENNAGSGTLSGTVTKAASSGVATFNDLSINNAGTGYTLTVTSGSLTSATSSAFNITSNAAQDITLVSGSCQSGIVSTALANPFVVKVTDSQGNAVSGVSIGWSITTVPYGSSGSELSSSTTVTDSEGEASSTLTLGDKPGLYKVEASVSGLSGSPVTFTATNGTTVFIKGGSYHKISLPYQFDNGNAESVFSQLGGYNPATWRLFRYANGAYAEYPNIPDFAPGLAYWLISANDETLVISGTAVSSNATVSLEPGWNQIGNPFKCSVTWDAIKAANAALFNNGTVADVLWGYDTEYLEFVAATALDSWQGFWVYNASGSNVDFIIPYQ